MLFIICRTFNENAKVLFLIFLKRKFILLLKTQVFGGKSSLFLKFLLPIPQYVGESLPFLQYLLDFSSLLNRKFAHVGHSLRICFKESKLIWLYLSCWSVSMHMRCPKFWPKHTFNEHMFIGLNVLPLVSYIKKAFINHI